jgi:hypothetical protein
MLPTQIYFLVLTGKVLNLKLTQKGGCFLIIFCLSHRYKKSYPKLLRNKNLILIKLIHINRSDISKL